MTKDPASNHRASVNATRGTLRALLVLLALCVFSPQACAADPTPAAEEPEGNTAVTAAPLAWDEWRRHHLRLKRRAGEVAPSVLFLGDSITADWTVGGRRAWRKHFEPLGAENFGIVADRTQTLLWRVQRGEYRRLDPTVVVLLIGANNIKEARNTADETSEGVLSNVDLLLSELPRSELLVVGVLPCGKWPRSPERIAAAEVNRLLRAPLRERGVAYVDPTSEMLNGDGELSQAVSRDYLHLTAEGYDRLAQSIAPKVASLLRSGERDRRSAASSRQ